MAACRPALRSAARLLLAAGTAVAAAPPPAAAQATEDPARRLVEIERLLGRLGAEHGDSLWPGFRPDTFPHLIVFRRAGKGLLNWSGEPLAGFARVPGSRRAEWSAAEQVSLPSGRGVAFSSALPEAPLGSIVALAAHEAFHVLERAMAREGWELGSGENSWLVRVYPELEAENEALWALEGMRLAAAMAALAAADDEAARRAAREFLAVREARQAALDPELSEYERRAEMNEGLAQYVQMRALRLLARELPVPWSRAAEEEATAEVALLGDLLAVGDQSLRRRFYATGSAIGLLLDRLAGPGWKRELVERGLTLQEALAAAARYGPEASPALRAEAERTGGLEDLRAAARRRIVGLLARRQAVADSALGGDGLLLVLDGTGLPGGLQGCGFDPQNLLQTGGGLLHARWVRFCREDVFEAEFETAVLEEPVRMARAALGDPADVRITAAGSSVTPADGTPESLGDLELRAPGVTLRAARADVARRGRVLVVRPLEE